MKKLLFAGLLGLFILSAPSFANEQRTMSVQHLTGASSYFKINVLDEGLLTGMYPGWCADWASLIEDATYDTKFYSSYSTHLPEGLIAHPENLDEVNWIVNQNFVGKNAGGGLGVYTSGDVQVAIWTLLDNYFETSTVGPFSETRVDKIVSLAQTLGKDFYPTCKEEVVIILDPGTPQSVLIEVKRNRFYKCVIPEGDVK
jgi:hypothetical protein